MRKPLDYADCPQCGTDEGMGICVEKGLYFIWCCNCKFSGPKVPGPPSAEADQAAVAAWNALPRRFPRAALEGAGAGK